MSDATTAPQHKQERSLGAEIARTSAISAASNAAGIAGVVGGLVLFSKLHDRYKAKSSDSTVTTESVTTES